MKPVDTVSELRRLSDGSGSDLASALRELSARGPDATELASLATRLSLQGVAMIPPAMTAPAGGLPVARKAVWKVALVGAAAISGIAWWLLRAPALPSSAQPAPSEVGVASAPQPSRGLAGSVASGKREGAPAALLPVAPSFAASPTASPSPSPPSPSPLEARAPAQQPRPAPPSLSQATEALPHRDGQAKGTATLAPRSAATGAEAPVTDPALPSELELLRGARLALKGSPAEALRLSEQHRTSYPGGKLTQERELIAISALLALGRRTAALARAASFEQAFPASPYRKQIGELLQ